ncbi:MAG TPA: hydroxymethylglutaryl-CoA lyase [Planctomycetota bacterium]|nr:hydroxymethylglutaryl-CoA lyase [Planctomycetota bacterium]
MRIVEVGPRDGLQNEPATVPTDAKVAFVDALGEAGVSEIEVSSFVSPKWVPQLADADEVFRRIRRVPGVLYSALVPNEKGLERAQAARADKVAVFTAASETFNRRNINASIAESIERFRPVVRAAGLPVRAYVSTAFWCPFEGRVAPGAVVDLARRLVDLGVNELSIGDTIGKATADEVRSLLSLLLPCAVPVALHFHDTYGRAVDNALTARREFGVEAFDSSAGGLGGCPYAPGASGNVATETLAAAFDAAGFPTGVRIEAVRRAAAALRRSPAG